MPLDPAMRHVLDLPFAEQADFFRRKLKLPTERYDDITHSAHDRAFIVAGAQKADLLSDLHEALQKAIDSGTTLETWRKDFEAIVARHGWTGWTGEGTAAGRDWRTRVIYDTNLRTSHAAGRYRQLTDSPSLRYWMYKHNDLVTHPRPQHQAWNGLVLPADHPFWQTHYPPNGWGCRCRVVGLAKPEDATRYGGDPGKTLPEGWDAIDAQTGEPVGIGQGWGYAPGATWHPDLDKYPETLARQIVADNLRDGVFERWVGKINRSVADELASGAYQGMDTAQTLTALRVKLGEQGAMPLAVLDAKTRQLLKADSQTLLLSDYDLVKQAVSRNGEYDALSYLPVQDLLDGKPYLAQQANGRYLLIPAGRKVPVAVIHRTEDGKELYLKSYREGFGPDETARSKKRDDVLREG